MPLGGALPYDRRTLAAGALRDQAQQLLARLMSQGGGTNQGFQGTQPVQAPAPAPGPTPTGHGGGLSQALSPQGLPAPQPGALFPGQPQRPSLSALFRSPGFTGAPPQVQSAARRLTLGQGPRAGGF